MQDVLQPHDHKSYYYILYACTHMYPCHRTIVITYKRVERATVVLVTLITQSSLKILLTMLDSFIG